MSIEMLTAYALDPLNAADDPSRAGLNSEAPTIAAWMAKGDSMRLQELADISTTLHAIVACTGMPVFGADTLRAYDGIPPDFPSDPALHLWHAFLYPGRTYPHNESGGVIRAFSDTELATLHEGRGPRRRQQLAAAEAWNALTQYARVITVFSWRGFAVPDRESLARLVVAAHHDAEGHATAWTGECSQNVCAAPIGMIVNTDHWNLQERLGLDRPGIRAIEQTKGWLRPDNFAGCHCDMRRSAMIDLPKVTLESIGVPSGWCAPIPPAEPDVRVLERRLRELHQRVTVDTDDDGRIDHRCLHCLIATPDHGIVSSPWPCRTIITVDEVCDPRYALEPPQ